MPVPGDASPRMNFVDWPPTGLIVALQYWEGDEWAAMRLACALADIEPVRRDDVTIAFCRRFDCPPSPIAADAYLRCAEKFRVLVLRSEREGRGHPRGCNELWSGVMEQLAYGWSTGTLDAASVFVIEADGAPLSVDWIDRIVAEHKSAIAHGKRVSGPFIERPVPHINGTLVAHLSLWLDRPSLRRTPPTQAWDIFHAAVLMSEAQPTPLIKSVYGARGWSPTALAAMSRETAWLTSTKDDSAIRFAESLRASAPFDAAAAAKFRHVG